MFRRYHPYLTVVFLILFNSNGFASNVLEPLVEADQLKQSNVGAYLGLGLELLPKELEAQLPEDVIIGQGILITGFAPDSPAPAQGIKQYDILLRYNGVAIEHPQQLIQLIKKDSPGKTVKLSIVRKGKVIDLPVTIGKQDYPLDEDQLDYQYNMQMLGYDGYKIAMPSKNYFEATIRYLAPDGSVRRRTFKGYFNQVMSEIQATPDLSQYAKQKVMSIIKEKKDDEEGYFGDWMPFSDGVF
jgi:hypothetical protein